MEPAPSTLQAIAALLIVLGLIYAVAWLLKKMNYGGTPLSAFGRGKSTKQLQLIETLWLDARYRLVLVDDRGTRRSLILGPQQATELSPVTGEAHAALSDLPAA